VTSYTAGIDLSNHALITVSDACGIDATRRHMVARLSAGQRVLLVLAHLRKDEIYTDLAAGFSVGITTVFRYGLWPRPALLLRRQRLPGRRVHRPAAPPPRDPETGHDGCRATSANSTPLTPAHAGPGSGPTPSSRGGVPSARSAAARTKPHASSRSSWSSSSLADDKCNGLGTPSVRRNRSHQPRTKHCGT
jgi:hypothetical protein